MSSSTGAAADSAADTSAGSSDTIPGPSDSDAAPSVRAVIFGPSRRATTVGVLLLISMVAFEAMGVGTAMPALVADLGALPLYAWPFVTFMAAAVFGTALGGRWCDLAGPRMPLVAAPLLFGAGLIVAGTSGGMPQLLVGRVLQGLGAGATTVAIYVLIALVYPERTRPAVFGLMSGAWVLPSLVGPPVSGLVTERFSWHWVFLGLVPVAGLAVALVVPAVRRLGPPAAGSAAGPDGAPAPAPAAGAAAGSAVDPAAGHAVDPGTGPARGPIVLSALGAALGVAGLSWAGQHPGAAAAGALAVAVLVLVPSMRRLLPTGVFRGAPGVAAVVACRGLLAGGFFTANAYLPLMLTNTHHWSLTAAGTPLVVSALGWSSASAWQGNHPDLPRPRMLRIGFALVVVGLAGLVPVAAGWIPGWVALLAWAAAGTGMGLGFSAVSFLLLRVSGPAEVGFNSSAAQMADQLTTATMIGVGGALLMLLGSPAGALPVLLAVLIGLAGCGLGLAARTGRRSRT
jgi:MFS family permease